MRSEDGKKGRAPKPETARAGRETPLVGAHEEILSKLAMKTATSRSTPTGASRGNLIPGFSIPRTLAGKTQPPPSGRRKGGIVAKDVIRDDDDQDGDAEDRIQITNTNDSPFRHICYLSIRTADGSLMRGSGWLVGPYTVITAGHCVWDREHGNDYSQSMQVYPARNGNISPRVANAVDFITVSGWSNHGDTVCDYGAVFLDEPLGDEFGFFAYAEEPDEDLRNMLIHVVGYPATIESGGRELVVDPPTLWGQVNRIRDVREQELGYTIDTTPGQSGCPVICWEGEDQFRVVGIHNEGSAGENFATRISAVVYDNIKKWKSWRPAN